MEMTGHTEEIKYRVSWRIGSAAPAIKRKKLHVLKWIVKNRKKYLCGEYDDPSIVVAL